MMHRIVWLSGLALVACQTEKPEPADTSPLNNTAVIISESSFNGALLPNTKGKSTEYVRADRRHSSNDFRFENWFLRNTAGRFFSGTDEILRIDRNLQWQLDSKEKTYTECPLLGCQQPAAPTTATRPTNDAPRQEEPRDEQCKLTVVKNAVKGSNQSDKKNIAGVESGLYKLIWTVELKDAAGKKALNTVTMDFWTANLNNEMKSALDLQNQFEQNYAKAFRNDMTVQQVIASKEVLAALATLGNTYGSKIENWAVNIGKELQKMKGYPLAIHIEWTAKDETCGAGAQRPTASPSVSTNPLDWLKGKAVEEKPLDTNAPLVQYHYEIKTMTVRSEHDSVFDVPRKYKLVK